MDGERAGDLTVTNKLFDLFGPVAVGPGVGLLFVGTTTTPRLLVYVVTHMALAVAFPTIVWATSRRARPRMVRRAEAAWSLSGGILVALIPWILLPGPVWSHYALGLIFVALTSSDVLFKALRPGLPWRSLLLIQAVSYALFFLVDAQSVPLLIACVIHSLHLLGGHEAVQQLVVRLRNEIDLSEERANTDPLTGLPNRRGLAAYLEGRRARNRPVVVAAVDVDDFKRINDRLGHHAGDIALTQLASHMTRGLGDEWLVARSGGDEFVCVTDSGTPEDARKTLSRVPSLVFEGSVLPMSVSVGVSTGPAEDSLLADAFAALRLSKQRGKHQFTPVDADLRREIRHARELGAQLAEAVAAQEIEIWAQPIVHLKGSKRGRVHSYECLARWATPDGTFVPPSTFIPMVDDQRLTRELGESIIEQGTSFLATLPEDISVSVNISVSHFSSLGFAEHLHAALAKRDLDPTRLTIEITEGEQIDEDAGTLKVARQLRTMGVGLAIDDFGTGYASLERVVTFPCSQLKLDRSIIRHADVAGIHQLLTGLTGMAHTSALELVAEGVETQDIADLLIESGVPLAQGYLFGRPKPLDEIVAHYVRPEMPAPSRVEIFARPGDDRPARQPVTSLPALPHGGRLEHPPEWR